MADVVIYPYNGSIAIIAPAPGTPLQTLIDTVPAGSPYAVVDRSTIPFDQNGYRAAWSYDFITPESVVGVDMPAAKAIFQEKKDVAAQTETQPLTQEYIVAISTGQPTGPIEAAISAIETARADTDYLAATDANDLTTYWPAILGTNPFIPPTAGVIFTGRGQGEAPLDMIPSYYVSWVSTVPQEQTELYIPATSTVISYGVPIPGEFDSAGDCFTTGNYTVQIRQVSTGFVLAEYECPFSPDGENVTFSFSGPAV